MMMNKTGTRTRGPITMEVCGAYRQTQNTKGRALSRHQSSQSDLSRGHTHAHHSVSKHKGLLHCAQRSHDASMVPYGARVRGTRRSRVDYSIRLLLVRRSYSLNRALPAHSGDSCRSLPPMLLGGIVIGNQAGGLACGRVC